VVAHRFETSAELEQAHTGLSLATSCGSGSARGGRAGSEKTRKQGRVWIGEEDDEDARWRMTGLASLLGASPASVDRGMTAESWVSDERWQTSMNRRVTMVVW
jgi:hypothetical protein